MNRRLRAPHRTAGAALAAAALLVTAPAGAAPARGPHPAVAPARADSGQAARESLPEESGEVPEEAYEELAGSPAGVGREHPGRPPDAPADPEFTTVSRPLHPVRPAPRPEGRERTGNQRPATPARPSPSPSPSPDATGPASALGTGPNARIADLAAHLLPLGTGLALMGVGLGYMGVRLRRNR
ncbi:hypothetical protein ACGFY6_18975 [Streptomyces sp. NPDC048387]|uniref:hypothetical protein n=1 Tax=Streptomyces sp. NPDC048387 TaxID=3365542 RepID=UPI0037174E05